MLHNVTVVTNRKLVSIGEKAAEKLTKLYKQEFPEEKPKITFPEWITDYILVNIEKDEILRRAAPNISKIGITNNVLYLKDSKQNKIIEIIMKDGILSSNDTNPIYLQFALTLSELVKLNKKN